VSDERTAAADEDAAEAARKVFAGPIAFLLSAPKLDVLPPADLPEVAFAGRSNVGKSSLLNALAGRSSLARTSNTPGRTQALNLFDVGEPPAFRLVDMPGYGFAEAPPALVRAWARLVTDYLRGRPSLRRVMVLVDCRRGLVDADRKTMKMLDAAAVSYQMVLTKADKLKPTEVEDVVARTTSELRRHVAAHPDLLVSSTVTGAGVEALRMAVLAAAT
jgi:GTP-binding protein